LHNYITKHGAKIIKLVIRTYDWLKAICGLFKKKHIACVGLR